MEFMKEFPDDATCLEYLWRQRYAPDGEHALCPKCNDIRTFKKYPMANRRTSWSCTACGQHVHPTAGTIFRVDHAGQATAHASLPSSVAAFHLAFGPDEALCVSAPTLSPYDSVFKIGRDGAVAIRYTGFGRPQGIAFDQRGDLFVVEALAGVSGLYRLPPLNDVNDVNAVPELMLSGPGLVGVAFSSNGTLLFVRTTQRIDCVENRHALKGVPTGCSSALQFPAGTVFDRSAHLEPLRFFRTGNNHQADEGHGAKAQR
jgi:hypothetical protein